MQNETLWGEKRRQREFVRKLEALGLPVPWELLPPRGRKKRDPKGVPWCPKPPWLWWDGEKHFRLDQIAMMQQVPHHRVYRWAMARPHLLHRLGKFWYARLVDPPVPGVACSTVPRSVKIGDTTFYSIPELARKRGLKPGSVRDWAIRRPELTTRIGKHLYCQDAGWYGRARLAAWVERTMKNEK